MTKTLSQASLARALGLSPPAISKLKKLGMPTSSVQAARAWRELNQSVARRKPEPPTAATPETIADFNASRALRESAEAGLSVLALGSANGTLLSRESVERGAFQAARMLRDQLSSCAGSLGALLAGMTSAQECEAEIRREHRHLLDSFVREVALMLGSPAAEPAPAA